MGQVIGFDFGAMFTMAEHLGVSPVAMAQFLPPIERVMVQELRAQSDD